MYRGHWIFVGLKEIQWGLKKNPRGLIGFCFFQWFHPFLASTVSQIHAKFLCPLLSFFFSYQQIPFSVSPSSVGHESRPFSVDFTVHEPFVASTNWWGHSRILPGHWKCDVGLCSQRKKCHHKPASEQWHVGFILCIIRSRDKRGYSQGWEVVF